MSQIQKKPVKVDLSSKLLIGGLKTLPKNMISNVFGKIADLKLPKRLALAQIKAFGKAVGADFDEAEKPASEYASLQEFFTRKLKKGARIIPEGENILLSPCDGFVGEGGPIEQDRLWQIKGKPYKLGTLLGDLELAESFENGHFQTLYLSPKNYHRFHAPVSGFVKEAIYLPGYLWPVNKAGLKAVDELFCVNERVVILIEPDNSREKRIAVVAVGATMVGRIKVNFDESLVSNRMGAVPTRRAYLDKKPHFNRGDELGRFEFGSTLVLLTEKGFYAPEASLRNGNAIKLYDSLGTVSR